MKRAGFLILVFAILPSSDSKAASSCLSLFRGLFTSRQTERHRQSRTRDRLERIANQIYTLANGSGRRLSASQAELRKATMVIDAYFYVGDIGPLVNRFNGPIRRVEDSFLRRKINLAILARLASYQSGQLSSDRAAMVHDFIQSGLLSSRSQLILETGNADDVKLLLSATARRLEAQNRYFEKQIGRDFPLYKVVREHLDKLMGADDKLLLEILARTDSRAVERAPSFALEAIAPPRKAELTSADMPVADNKSLLEVERREKKVRVKRRLDSLDENLKKVKTWIVSARGDTTKDLYLQHVVNQYYPSLNLLKLAPGDPEKKADLLENLNAGSRDELLLTFARRADMKNTWEVIKDVAFKHQKTDHLHLYDRMVQAEERGRDLGTISIIDQSSYLRYIVSAVLNGSLIWAGDRWLGPGFMNANSDDDDKKKKKPLDDTIAHSPLHLVNGGDDRTEERALNDAIYLVRAASPRAGAQPINPQFVRAAAYDLMSLEESLSGQQLAEEGKL